MENLRAAALQDLEEKKEMVRASRSDLQLAVDEMKAQLGLAQLRRRV